MSRLLYQLSYTAKCEPSGLTRESQRPCSRKRPQTVEAILNSNESALTIAVVYGRFLRAPLRNRTVDLLLTMETLYRLS